MEQPITFESQGRRLVGIVSPSEKAQRAVVFLGGWAGYRVGPHRIFVKLARRMAASGTTSLRFDFRGRGDSEGAANEATLHTMIQDTEAALAWLDREVPAASVTLIGLCSGASVAMGVRHPRVDRLILWSPPSPRDQRPAGETHRRRRRLLREYAGKLLQGSTWRKIMTRQVRPRMIASVLLGAGPQGPTDDVTEALCHERLGQFRGRALFVFGSAEPDTKIAEAAYRALCARYGVAAEFHSIPDSDHSFYALPWEEEAMDTTLRWLEGHR